MPLGLSDRNNNIKLETLRNTSVLDGTVLEVYNVCGEQNIAPEG